MPSGILNVAETGSEFRDLRGGTLVTKNRKNNLFANNYKIHVQEYGWPQFACGRARALDCPPQPNSRMSVSALIYYRKRCFKIQLGGIQEHVLFRTLERQITAVRHRKSTGGPKTNTLPIRKKSVRRPPTQTGYPRLPVRVGTRTATRVIFII
mgnify:CR=1 FL=1